MKDVANQLYPPEPPPSFPPMNALLANQLYPPEPPLSFPPTSNALAEQLYPPEPPPSFPPATQVIADQLYPPEPPISFPPLSATGPREMLSTTSLNAATPHGRSDNSLRVQAEALSSDHAGIVNMLGSSRGFAMQPQQTMDLSQVYVAGGVLMVVVVALTVALGRRRDKQKKASEQRVEFTDSYEPFLG